MAPGPRSHRGRASFANGQNFWEVGLHQCPSESKDKGGPVYSLRVPSLVPSIPQTAAKVRGSSLTAPGFTAETDWLLEGDGFELPVPRKLGLRRGRRLALHPGSLTLLSARPRLERDQAAPGFGEEGRLR